MVLGMIAIIGSNPMRLEPPNPIFRNTQQHHAIVHPLTDPTWKMKQVLTAGSSGSICAPWSFTSIPDILAYTVSVCLWKIFSKILLGTYRKCHVCWCGFGSDVVTVGFFALSSLVRASVRALLQRVIRARVTQLRPAARELTETTGTCKINGWNPLETQGYLRLRLTKCENW